MGGGRNLGKAKRERTRGGKSAWKWKIVETNQVIKIGNFHSIRYNVFRTLA